MLALMRRLGWLRGDFRGGQSNLKSRMPRTIAVGRRMLAVVERPAGGLAD